MTRAGRHRSGLSRSRRWASCPGRSSNSSRDLAKRLAELEDKTEALAMNHDTFSRNTRNQLKQVFDALRELMTPPDPLKRPIGFISPEDKGNKTSSQAKRKT